MVMHENWKIWQYDEVTSTMDRAKVLAKELLPRQKGIIIAKKQTQGRGRHGHSWESPEGGFYATYIVKDSETQTPIQYLSLLVGLVIVDALNLSSDDIGLKWPNDVITRKERKKLGGILVESVIGEDGVVYFIGIGINLQKQNAPQATSLYELGKVDLSTQNIADLITSHLDTALQTSQHSGFEPFREGWDRWCLLKGKQIRVKNGEDINGLCKGIASDGALCVETPTMVKKIYSGSISQW